MHEVPQQKQIELCEFCNVDHTIRFSPTDGKINYLDNKNSGNIKIITFHGKIISKLVYPIDNFFSILFTNTYIIRQNDKVEGYIQLIYTCVYG